MSSICTVSISQNFSLPWSADVIYTGIAFTSVNLLVFLYLLLKLVVVEEAGKRKNRGVLTVLTQKSFLSVHLTFSISAHAISLSPLSLCTDLK